LKSSDPRHFNVKKWLTMVGVSIGIFIFALDVYVINLALPAMIESLDTNFAVIQWVVLSYLITIAAYYFSIAQLGDIWNKKHLYESVWESSPWQS
jgi:MFS family permease